MAGDLLVDGETGDSRIWYCYDSASNLAGASIDGKRLIYRRNIQNDITRLIDLAGNVVVEYTYDS